MEEAQTQNVLNPEGALVSIPSDQLQNALTQGYKEAAPEDVEKYKKEEKYGTLPQQLLTGVEGAAQAATFGLSTGAERALGVPEEDIMGRREVNPGTHLLGQIPGLAATAAIPGFGAAKILQGAGEGAAGLLGLGEASAPLISKLGSSAVKGAVETAMLTGGDEVSKMLASDPNQSVETAVSNIGMSALLGGGFGAGLGTIHPLWKATSGSKVGQILQGIANKVGGVEGKIPDAIHDAIESTGMTVPAEVRAGLSGDPRLQQMFQTLQESSTGSGAKAQEALRTFRSEAGRSLTESFGKNADDLSNLVHLSEYDAGKEIKDSLAKELKAQIDPISKQFDEVKTKFAQTELPTPMKAQIAEDVGNLSATEGYNLSPSSTQAKEVNRILTELPNLKTLDDLRKYQSIINDNTSTPELYRLGSQLKKILRKTEEEVVTTSMGEVAPEMMGTHQAARQSYRAAMDTIDELNSRLHVGRFGGPDSFINALKEMSPEDVLRRLSGKGDADLLKLVQNQFPEAANKIREFQINNLLKNASMRAGEGEVINSKALLSSIEKMSPELRSFVIPEESMGKISAVKDLLESLPGKMNNSGTAKTLDALWNKIPDSALGMTALLTGHNSMAALLLTPLTKWIGRDIPDAVRLGILKFMGSGQSIESEGFKAMVDFIQHTIEGENLLSKASKNLFKAGVDVLPQSFLPNEKQVKKLDKQLSELKTDPSPLFNVGGKTGHYLPDQGTVMGQISANASNYLNGLRPSVDKKNPLDSEIKPSSFQEAAYHRALQIAEQPMVVLNHIAKGTLTPSDVQTLKTIYPALYQRMSQKITFQMMETVSKGDSIPYKTRLNLSLFLGMPLDSTMTSQGILSAQPKMVSPMPTQAPRTKHSTASLNKLAEQDMTAAQAAEAKHLK